MAIEPGLTQRYVSEFENGKTSSLNTRTLDVLDQLGIELALKCAMTKFPIDLYGVHPDGRNEISALVVLAVRGQSVDLNIPASVLSGDLIPASER
ncbi:hypothetical protein ACFO7V_05715 [Glutamicibacter bergerei]|uniref:XRE family transcriptional regulator n=1 Tax=Glutamicibacter bergerei TaxID=256702 RepID=A0ABV9MJD3_9MICC|nr:hypothetical protein [Micrococcaceae bacterium]